MKFALYILFFFLKIQTIYYFMNQENTFSDQFRI